MTNTEIVRHFEEEFKNKANHGVVDELMGPDFVHHLPFPGLPPGRAGLKAVGELVRGAFDDVHVTVQFILAEGSLVADRIVAKGRRKDNGQPIAWTENHIYVLRDGKIVELWPEGGPGLG
jgi:ketosteroid isomerase-like protein